MYTQRVGVIDRSANLGGTAEVSSFCPIFWDKSFFYFLHSFVFNIVVMFYRVSRGKAAS